jgi:uncharacterized RDD family membrane protein YckC
MAWLTVETPEGVALRAEIAGPGRRFAAGVADGLLLAVLLSLVALVALATRAYDPTGISHLATGVLLAGTLLVAILYHVLFHGFWEGQTPGKRLLSIQVASLDGSAPGWQALILRGLIWPIDVLLFVPVSIGLLAIWLGGKRQRLGDVVAGTLVLVRGGEGAREPFPQEKWSDILRPSLPLTPALAARLNTRDAEFLRELLTRRGLEPSERKELFLLAADHYARILGTGSFDDARVVLKEIYLFLREQRAARAF